MKAWRNLRLFFQLSTYRELYNLTWLAVRNEFHHRQTEGTAESKVKAQAGGGRGK
jgi:hypothetical protein